MNTLPTKFDVNRTIENTSPQAANEKFLSLSTSKDWNSGRQEKHLESYSAKYDKLIAEATDVAKLYEKLSAGNVDKVASFDSHLPQGVSGAVKSFMDAYSDFGKNSSGAFNALRSQRMFYTEVEVKKNPEKIREEAKARLAYCNAMVATLKEVLRINNEALDLSISEAKALSDALSGSDEERSEAIKAIKAAIMNNEGKFKTKFGFDFKPIGGGIVLVQLDGTGQIAGEFSVEKLVQYCYNYDAVVFSHGNASKKGKTAGYDKAVRLTNELQQEITQMSSKDSSKMFEYIGKLETLSRFIFDNSLTDEQKQTLAKEYDTKLLPVLKKFKDQQDKLSTEAAMRAQLRIGEIMKKSEEIEKLAKEVAWVKHKDSNRNKEWGIGEVSTPWGKNYTEVVSLCKDLISHGYKKIKLVACNPGSFDLRKIRELKKQEGVTISFAMSSIGVSETASPVTKGMVITEGFKSAAIGVLSKLKNLITTAWEKIKKAFRWIAKKAVEIGRRFITFVRKVKDKFKKDKKTHHVSINPTSGKVEKAVTTNTDAACNIQAKNISKTGEVIDKIVKVQDIAFNQYMKLIDALTEEGKTYLKETADNIVSAAEKILEHTHLCTLTGGFDTSDEPISVDYLRDFPSFA